MTLIENKKKYNKAIRRFLTNQPQYPVTVQECRELLRHASVIQQSCDYFGHLECEEDCAALGEIYMVVGASLLNCIHNGGCVELSVLKHDKAGK